MRTFAVFVENRPFFGALLVHVPLLHTLRRRHPDAHIALLAPFADAELLVRLGCADELLVYPHGIAPVQRLLRALAPDTVLVLRPASQWLELAVGLERTATRVGFHSWLGRLLYTRTVPHDTGVYRARKYLTTVLDRPAALAAPLDAWFRVAAAHAAPARPAEGPTLLVLPGGGAGAFKLWGAERFVALCERLAARDPALRFAWVLGPLEAAVRGRVAASPVAGRSEFLVDRPVADLAAAAFAARAAVGNDCGPGHVVQMCGCPFACVMSDHDGRAAGRIAEWIDTANRRFTTVSAPRTPIDRVPLQAVEAKVFDALRAR